MTRILLKFASAYQWLALVVLVLSHLTFNVMKISFGATIFFSDVAVGVLNFVMNLALAQFYWKAQMSLAGLQGANSQNRKLKFWGLLSIFSVGLNQFGEVVMKVKKRPSIESMNTGALDVLSQVLLFANSLKPILYKIIYISGSTANLFFILLLYSVFVVKNQDGVVVDEN
ncbi:hypothetical protein [Bdellovibrio svalbardensis]|uniref:GtrA-like protein domain-containing protein n=1 Tax=Bdellovibrio svalbardensis TaxID=2972972 RepID=A0ABT6DHX6_9BACT|nr:hypothetical protein [Bdellovibrio svalbardensis]MDG0816461.1 hypothetical protein [Bdellovibrio svalbardensis]